MSRLSKQTKVRPCPREVISRVLRFGRRFEGAVLSLKTGTVPDSTKATVYWGAIVGNKQLSRAVDRHRFKRLVRETIQTKACEALGGHAIVTLLRQTLTTPISWPTISQELQQLLDKTIVHQP